MDINITSVHFTADQKLLDYINKKSEKMQRLGKNIVAADVFLKLENSGQVKDKIVEIKIHVPNSVLIATEKSKVFETSVDSAIENMVRQLKRRKEKLISHHS